MHDVSDTYKFIYFDQILDLKGLAQMNSIGCATIMDPAFNIQCGKSRCDQNQTIWQYTLSGSIIVEDQNGRLEVPEGSCFIVNSTDEQTSYYYPVGGTKAYKCLWITSIGTSVEFCEDLVAKYGRIFKFNSIPKSFMWAWDKLRFAKLIQQENLSKFDSIFQIQSLINDFIALTGKNNAQCNPYYQLARNEVINHINLPFNVQDLSKILGVTPVHLARLFAKHGLSNPRLFINEIKVDHAINLLQNTRMSIKEISLSLGYDTSSHFARSFSKIKGKSPREFRDYSK